jgi:hypothetical protein
MLASDHFHVSLEKEYDHASIDRSMMTHMIRPGSLLSRSRPIKGKPNNSSEQNCDV